MRNPILKIRLVRFLAVPQYSVNRVGYLSLFLNEEMYKFLYFSKKVIYPSRFSDKWLSFVLFT